MKIGMMAAGLGVAGLLLAGVGAGPAVAGAPVERERYSGSEGFDEMVCGLAVHIEVEFSGMFMAQPVPGETEPFFGHDVYRFSETITLAGDLDGEPFVTTSGWGNFREIDAVLLDPEESTIWQFSAVDAGHIRLYDSSGARIMSGNGVALQTVVFDTLGDGEVGGEFVEDVSFEFHGHDSADFCEVFVEALTGA